MYEKYIRVDVSRIDWKVKILLWFVPKQSKIVHDPEGDHLLEWKVWNKVIYIVRFELLPPKHVNCRCEIAD